MKPYPGARLARSLALLLLGAALAQQAPSAPLPPERQAPATDSAPDQAPDAQPTDIQPTDAQPSDAQPTDTQPSGAQPSAAPSGDLPSVSITLTRKTKSGETRNINIERVGTDETGISATCAPQDDDPGDAPTIVVYSNTTERGVEVTVDKNLIRAPLAVISKLPGGDGHIEMSSGTAKYLDEAPEGKTDRLSKCEVEADPKVASDTVRVTQGKTKLLGSKLVYDESNGIARVSGPISFTREKLTGSSKRIDVDVEKQVTTLVGDVQLRDGERTSKAGRVDYDDGQNVAILRGTPGQPAETITPGETLRAETIRYNLDSGEAVVVRGTNPITGKFDDGDPATSPTSGPPTSGSPAPGNQAPSNPLPGEQAPGGAAPVNPTPGNEQAPPSSNPQPPNPGDS